jgi:hypothetical protein
MIQIASRISSSNFDVANMELFVIWTGNFQPAPRNHLASGGFTAFKRISLHLTVSCSTNPVDSYLLCFYLYT